MKLKIAGFVVEYDGTFDDYADRMAKYSYNSTATPDVTIKYRCPEKIELPDLSDVHDESSWKVGNTPDGGTAAYIAAKKSGRVLTYIENDAEYKNISSAFVKMPNSGPENLTDADREYVRGATMFNSFLLSRGGTTLHGSCISYNGEGVVFCAPSGMGKSTHTALWKTAFGDKVEFVNDDKPAVSEKDGKLFISGTPWSGKHNISSNITVPLKAVVFLERGKENEIKSVSTAETVGFLNAQTFPPFYDKKLCMNNFDVIEKIINTVPTYRLFCNMDISAATVSKNAVFGEK